MFWSSCFRSHPVNSSPVYFTQTAAGVRQLVQPGHVWITSSSSIFLQQMLLWAKQVPAFWSGPVHIAILSHPCALSSDPSPCRGSPYRSAWDHLSLASLVTPVCWVQFSLAPPVLEHTPPGHLRHTVLWQRGHWWEIELQRASLENMLMQRTMCNRMPSYLVYVAPASCGSLKSLLQTK